jgi:hypothetical protein
MKLLRRCDHLLHAAHLANVLRAAGVRCSLRNTTLAGGIGDIPFMECGPELWIDNDLDEAHAHALLAEVEAATPESETAAVWRCLCGEAIEPQFGACWQCGASRFAPG